MLDILEAPVMRLRSLRERLNLIPVGRPKTSWTKAQNGSVKR
jgi:hypothetical protein